MRERDDIIVFEMLNEIRVGDVDNAVKSLLKSRLAVQNENLSNDSLYVFPENATTDAQNKILITQFNTERVFIKAIDKFI